MVDAFYSNYFGSHIGQKRRAPGESVHLFQGEYAHTIKDFLI